MRVLSPWRRCNNTVLSVVMSPNPCSWLTYLLGVCPQWYENHPTFPLPGFQESPRIVRNSCSVRPGGSLLTLALMPSCAAALDLADLDESAGPCVCAGRMGRTPACLGPDLPSVVAMFGSCAVGM